MPCIPGATPQSDDGRVLSAASSQVCGHAKGKRAEEVAGDASEPLGTYGARDAGRVPRVRGRSVARHAAAAAATAAGGWLAAAVVARPRLYSAAR